MSDDTALAISGPGIPDYSARGLTQTLDPIDASAVIDRTVNGGAIDLSPPQMRKYKSSISCSDVETPALDGVWPGMVLTIDCVAELGYASGGDPGREVVEGSERDVGGWIFYRPRLSMMVRNFTVSRNEWGGITAWSLDLEET